MRLQEMYAGSISKTGPLGLDQLLDKREKPENSTALPSSWGSDRVSLSPEARAAFEARSDEDAQAQERETASGASEDFAAYMKKSRSKAQSASPDKQIEALKKKLKSLQGQLSAVAASNRPESEKTGKIESIQMQMNTIMAQIAELAAEQDVQAAGASGAGK